MSKKIKDCSFKLLQPLNGWRKGKVFDSYGGLVSGVDGVSFLDINYFKPVKITYW